jgi:hypothetical protein
LVGKDQLLARHSVAKEVVVDVPMERFMLGEGCQERQLASQQCDEAHAYHIRASDLNRSQEPPRRASSMAFLLDGVATEGSGKYAVIQASGRQLRHDVRSNPERNQYK